MLNATHKTVADKLDALESYALSNTRRDQQLHVSTVLTDIATLRTHLQRARRTDYRALNRISRHVTALRSSYNNTLQHYYAA